MRGVGRWGECGGRGIGNVQGTGIEYSLYCLLDIY